MGADGDADVFQYPVVFLHGGVVDGHAGIVDDLVDNAEGIRLRRPLEVVDGLRPVAFARRVDLVDRDHLTGLRLRQEIFIMESPPRRRVAAEALALVLGIGARTRAEVDDADLEDIAGLGATDTDGAGADMHAETFARAPAEQRRLHRAGAPAIDALPLLVPVEDALGARIALDHPLGVVIGVMRENFQRDKVAGGHLDHGLERLAEVAPVHGLVGGRHVVMIRRARHPSRLRLGLRHSHRSERRRHAADRQRALQELTAPVRLVCHGRPPPPMAVARRMDCRHNIFRASASGQAASQERRSARGPSLASRGRRHL